ncbi:hypothetical protein JCM8547_005000 [Rhodosporidiobolus lusitaniae]
MSNPLNFAPYEPAPDSTSRPSLSSWSDPAASTSSSFPTSSSSYQSGAPVSSLSNGASFSSSSSSGPYPPSGYAPPGSGGGTLDNGYHTTTLRHDYAGPLCYALGPLGAAVMLVFEVENDWVRYQAWQSILLNACLVFLHLFFLMLFGREFFQYLLVLLDIGALGLLTLRAYHDSDHLERYKLPLLGPIADSIVRSE